MDGRGRMQTVMSKLGIVLIGCGALCACNRTTAGTAGEGGGPGAATASGSTGPGSMPDGGRGGAAASPNLPAAGTSSATVGALTGTAGGNVQLGPNGRPPSGMAPSGTEPPTAPGTIGTATGTGLAGTPIPGPVGGTIAPLKGVPSTSMYLPTLRLSVTVPSASTGAPGTTPTSSTNPAAGLGPNVPGLNGTSGVNGFAPSGLGSQAPGSRGGLPTNGVNPPTTGMPPSTTGTASPGASGTRRP